MFFSSSFSSGSKNASSPLLQNHIIIIGLKHFYLLMKETKRLYFISSLRPGSLPVNEVAQVVEQFRVVFEGHVCPGEGRVLTLGPQVEQVEAPHVRRDACVLCHVSKHPHTSTLGEFSILVVQIL